MLLKPKDFLGGGTIFLVFAALLMWFFQQMDTTKNRGRYLIEFVREEVELTITAGTVEINGNYFIRSAMGSPRPVPLYYPFPVSSTCAFPDSIAIFSISSSAQETIDFRVAGDRRGIYFTIPLFPQSTTEFRVYYRQRISGKFARYILRSTWVWSNPLQQAKFVIRVPKSVGKVHFSLQPNLKTVENSYTVYQIIRRDFLPQEDLLIWWQ